MSPSNIKILKLKVSKLHTIHIEDCGNPDGLPIIFIHGGPGGGTNEKCLEFFNLETMRVILFDQRGCGKSTPFAELKENDTWNLIEDIEKIRKKLEIEKWLIFGGSWGSTLAISYGINNPDKCLGFILRGIFLLREWEIKWFYQEGASRFFPDLWESFLEPIEPINRSNLVEAYYKIFTSDNTKLKEKAAKAWTLWEGSTSKLLFDNKTINDYSDEKFYIPFALIECHYFINKGFFSSDNYLLENISKVSNLPCKIIQGRYDVICPTQSAWELHRAWKDSEIFIEDASGHSAFEESIYETLKSETQKLVNKVIQI
jgi:proline iminopeptidase